MWMGAFCKQGLSEAAVRLPIQIQQGPAVSFTTISNSGFGFGFGQELDRGWRPRCCLQPVREGTFLLLVKDMIHTYRFKLPTPHTSAHRPKRISGWYNGVMQSWIWCNMKCRPGPKGGLAISKSSGSRGEFLGKDSEQHFTTAVLSSGFQYISRLETTRSKMREKCSGNFSSPVYVCPSCF